MEQGFVKAQSDNLPAVTVFMVTDCIRKWNDEIPESTGSKQLRSCREEYGDSAVGYVQLRRDSERCHVKARVCPEHRVSKKAYFVEVFVNEKENSIEEAKCLSCAAAEGGCKHIIAFLMWCHRRSEEPSVTAVTSYWAKPKLAQVVGTSNPVKCKDFLKRRSKPVMRKKELLNVLKISKDKKINSVLYKSAVLDPLDSCDKLGIQFLCTKFFRSFQQDDASFTNFWKFAENVMCKYGNEIEEIYHNTLGQSSEPQWFNLRYGRITASRLKEASTCKTEEGSLVKRILGSSNKFSSTLAMKRGLELEPEVLMALSDELGCPILKCGLKLRSTLPVFGSSADGILSDSSSLVEVKCPATAGAIKNYVKDGELQPAVKLQMQLNMLMHGVRRCILCLASPTFEADKKFQTFTEELNHQVLDEALQRAKRFYEMYLFPKLKTMYS